MKKIWCLLSVALLLGCTALAHADDKPLAKPEVLGEETIHTSQRLSAYSTVIIRDFDISNVEYENIDADEKKDIEPIKDSLPKVLSANFVNELKEKNRFKNVLSNSDKTDNAVIIEGKITKLSGGHGAAKFFLGWMAPQSAKTHIETTGKVIDAKTGKVLAEFSDSKAGVTGSAMGWVKEVLIDLAGHEGRDIADFVDKLY